MNKAAQQRNRLVKEHTKKAVLSRQLFSQKNLIRKMRCTHQAKERIIKTSMDNGVSSITPIPLTELSPIFFPATHPCTQPHLQTGN
jgi:hypothetical protein